MGYVNKVNRQTRQTNQTTASSSILRKMLLVWDGEDREPSLRSLVRERKFKMRCKEEKEPAMLREGWEAFLAEGAAGLEASRWERF